MIYNLRRGWNNVSFWPLKVPNNVAGWRKNFKNQEKSEITRVQCDPVMAHQDILGISEEYKGGSTHFLK